MRIPFFLLVVAACTFNVAAQPRRVVFPRAIDASLITEVGGAICSRSVADSSYNCIVRFVDDCCVSSVMSDYGLRSNTVAGCLSTVQVPKSQIAEIASDSRVISISSGSRVRTMTDEAVSLTHVDDVHNLGESYRGHGVIIGVIDSGFDFCHSAFLDENGQTRVVTVWDQLRTTAPVGSPSEFGYGIVVDNPVDIAALAHDYSYDTHGTHVAAIAASSADLYGGMAPDAELALVSTDKSEAGVADGLRFLIDYAAKAGKPLVVNISLGTVVGFKDGSDNLALMIDALVEDHPGVIVAVAAGNEGHRRSTLVRDDATSLNTTLIPPSYGRENLFIGSTIGDFEVTLSLIDSKSDTVFACNHRADSAESVRFDEIIKPGDGSFVALSGGENALTGGCYVSLNLYAPLTEGMRWDVQVNGPRAKYIMTADYGELTGGSRESTIACTACGYNTIAVGAYVSRTGFVNLAGQERAFDWAVGDEYYKSGQGPTFDGRVKPDVLAPGACVISAINSYASAFSVNRDDLVVSRQNAVVPGKTDYWGEMSGTSMATPVVTGIIALWLQADPSLNVEDVRDILAGMDKIDAYKGLQLITAGITESVAASDSSSGVQVYDMTGRVVGNFADTSALRHLRPGVYIVKCGEESRKVVISAGE